MEDVEAHQHGLRSPIAAIAGIASAALQRHDLDDDIVTQLRAIKELADDALEALQNTEG
jgi:hypothetical protein